jgi:hypothetical protein
MAGFFEILLRFIACLRFIAGFSANFLRFIAGGLILGQSRAAALKTP